VDSPKWIIRKNLRWPSVMAASEEEGEKRESEKEKRGERHRGNRKEWIEGTGNGKRRRVTQRAI